MRPRLALALGLALVSGCGHSYRDYEVGELEEERVQKAVKALAAGLERHDAAQAAAAFVPEYRDPAFDPGRMDVHRIDDSISIGLWTPNGPEGAHQEMDRKGMEGYFAAYLGQWRVLSRALAKIRRVDVSEDGKTATGRFFIDIYGVTTAGEAREDFLYVEAGFEKRENTWMITAYRTDSLYCTFASRAQFRNVSRESNAEWPHVAHPQARGYLPIPQQTPDSGVACSDFDGDGYYDLYVCNGRACTLLRNKGDGTFEDVTAKAGVANEDGEARAAVFADLDNDGHPDLFVSNNHTSARIFRNNGDGTFADVTEGSGIAFVNYCTSVSVADYDRDGLLDVYQGVYGDFYTKFPAPPVNDAEPNRLYHNKGGFKFEEVAVKAGCGDTGWTLAASWGDPNNDGWPDVLVANDFGDHRLYINQKDGTFREVAEEIGLKDRNFGMSAAFGDIDNDGNFDVYFSNMYSNTNWIFKKDELLPMPKIISFIRNKILGELNEMTLGNSLYRNNGDGTYSNITDFADVRYGQWAWMSEFLDYDADGLLDIYCCNGFISGTDADDL